MPLYGEKSNTSGYSSRDKVSLIAKESSGTDIDFLYR